MVHNFVIGTLAASAPAVLCHRMSIAHKYQITCFKEAFVQTVIHTTALSERFCALRVSQTPRRYSFGVYVSYCEAYQYFD